MTTAHTLSVIAYHLISDTEMLERLQDELKTVMPRPDSKPKWNQLEQLPYFVSLIIPYACRRTISDNNTVSGCPGRSKVHSIPFHVVAFSFVIQPFMEFSIIDNQGRWGYGVTERLQRVSPDEALTFNDWTIPPGVGSSRAVVPLCWLICVVDTSRHVLLHPAQQYRHLPFPTLFPCGTMARFLRHKPSKISRHV